MNDSFKRELMEILKENRITMSQLAFEVGFGQPYLSNVLSNHRPLARKALSSIIETLTSVYGIDEDRLFRLAILGCQRYLAERDLDQLCTVNPDRMMAWIHAEPSYAAKISIRQKAQIQRRIREAQ